MFSFTMYIYKMKECRINVNLDNNRVLNVLGKLRHQLSKSQGLLRLEDDNAKYSDRLVKEKVDSYRLPYQ